MSFLTLGDYFDDIQVARSAAQPFAADYASCVGDRGGLERTFFVQDPRQEETTQAHRAGDPCYSHVSSAIYVYAKPMLRELALQMTGRSWAIGPSDADVAAAFTAMVGGSGYTLRGYTFSAQELSDVFMAAAEEAEPAARLAAERHVGRVRAQEVVPSPLVIGAEEYARRVEEHAAKVRTGEVVRTVRREDVISPAEQLRREREAEDRARRNAAARGPLVSCPRGQSIEDCLRDRVQPSPPPAQFPWLWLGLGLAGAAGVVLVARGR